MSDIKKTIGVLVLFIIIVSMMIYCISKVYALQEFIDDYENKNYIQYKYNIVRNTSLDCMELIYTLGGGFGNLENYNTYTEFDNNNHITITSNTSLTHIVYRNEDAYLYDDKGINHFDYSLPFEHRFEFKSDFADIYNNGILWCLANEVDDWQDINSSERVSLRTYKQDTGNRIVNMHGLDTDNSIPLTANIWYYVTIINYGNGTLKSFFYDGSERTNLIDTLKVSVDILVKTRYIYACETNNLGGLARVFTNYIANLDIGEGQGYEDFGYYYTKNMLNSLNGSSVVLLTNSTIPENDLLTIEFSSDNFTWVNHNNVGGSDTLMDGFESIDLRDCSFLTLYMRFNFSDGGSDSTSRLYQIRVITNGTCDNGTSVTEYLFYPIVLYGICGSFILIAVIAVLGRKR